MKLAASFLILLLASVAYTERVKDVESDEDDDDVVQNDPETVEKANEHLDKVLELARDDLEELRDPIDLIDTEKEFSHQDLLANITGKAKLLNGTLYRFLTFKRAHDCDTLKVKEDYVIKCRIDFEDLVAYYIAEMHFMDSESQVHIRNTIKRTRMSLNYGKTGNSNVAFISNTIEHLGENFYEITNNFEHSWQYHVIMDFATDVVSKILSALISDTLIESVKKHLEEVPLELL